MSSARSEAFITIEGADVPILVRRYAAAKSYRLRYDPVQGVLRLSMPVRGSEREAMRWAREQRLWIGRQISRKPQPCRLVPGALVPVEGVERLIDWNRTRSRHPVLEADRILVGGSEESVGSRLTRWLRRRALATLERETREIAGREGLSVTSVAIGDPRGRWGSCATNGAIRYSWRLILAPADVLHATVAHEVAHLLHMDHSAEFHAAHRRLLGSDPRPARAWLREHGAGLHRFTA